MLPLKQFQSDRQWPFLIIKCYLFLLLSNQRYDVLGFVPAGSASSSSTFRISKTQTTCDGCFAHQSFLCSVISLDSSTSGTAHPQEVFCKGGCWTVSHAMPAWASCSTFCSKITQSTQIHFLCNPFSAPCKKTYILPLAGAATSIIFVATNVLLQQNTLLLLQKYACHDKPNYVCCDEAFVVTNIILLQQTFCRGKLTFVGTNICLSQQIFCHNKKYAHHNKTFVTTNVCITTNICNDKSFVRTKIFCHDKHSFVP